MGSALFAITLVVSAWLKAMAPEPAAHGLAWTGLAFPARVVILDAVSLGEVVVGGLLLSAVRNRGVLSCASVLAVLLIAFHALGRLNGISQCGCFGSWRVPDEVTMTIVTVGLMSCVMLAMRAPNLGFSRRAFVVPGVLVATLVIPLVQRPHPTGRVEGEMVAAVGGVTKQETLLILGSRACDHCVEALERLQRTTDVTGIRCVFITRTSDRNPPGPEAGFRWLEFRSVPDEVWWRTALQELPTYIRCKGGVPGDRSDDWR